MNPVSTRAKIKKVVFDMLMSPDWYVLMPKEKLTEKCPFTVKHHLDNHNDIITFLYHKEILMVYIPGCKEIYIPAEKYIATKSVAGRQNYLICLGWMKEVIDELQLNKLIYHTVSLTIESKLPFLTRKFLLERAELYYLGGPEIILEVIQFKLKEINRIQKEQENLENQSNEKYFAG